MHTGRLIVPNEEICEVIPQGECRLHVLQRFSVDWEITGKYLVRDSPFLARRTGYKTERSGCLLFSWSERQQLVKFGDSCSAGDCAEKLSYGQLIID